MTDFISRDVGNVINSAIIVVTAREKPPAEYVLLLSIKQMIVTTKT